MNQQKNIHYFEDVNYLRFLNPTCMEEFGLEVGECFPTSTNSSWLWYWPVTTSWEISSQPLEYPA